METAEIVQQFERATGRFARAAVQAAVARRDEVTPALLLILQETTDRRGRLRQIGLELTAFLWRRFSSLLLVNAVSMAGGSPQGQSGESITDVLRNADAAMYFEKMGQVHLHGEAEGRFRGAIGRPIIIGQIEVRDSQIERASQHGAAVLQTVYAAEIVPQS